MIAQQHRNCQPAQESLIFSIIFTKATRITQWYNGIMKIPPTRKCVILCVRQHHPETRLAHFVAVTPLVLWHLPDDGIHGRQSRPDLIYWSILWHEGITSQCVITRDLDRWVGKRLTIDDIDKLHAVLELWEVPDNSVQNGLAGDDLQLYTPIQPFLQQHGPSNHWRANVNSTVRHTGQEEEFQEKSLIQDLTDLLTIALEDFNPQKGGGQEAYIVTIHGTQMRLFNPDYQGYLRRWSQKAYNRGKWQYVYAVSVDF